MASPSSIVGRMLGRYKILGQIGAGGMGVVYRAHDQRLERDVALKVLPPGALADASAHRRFRQEALALSQLNHPNIATVHDFDDEGEVPFLVAELVPGATLDDQLTAGPLQEKDVVHLGAQLAEGLEAAHRAGVIHRDLKPANLRRTPEGRLKILDFGLAKRIDPADETSVTCSAGDHDAAAGTLAYMAPEQLRGENVDTRSDLWAAGIVLYELATGRRPFEGKTETVLADQVLHTAPPSPLAFEPRLSPRLADIVLKCLEKDPENRYQSARELLVDLRRLAAPTTAVTPVAHPRRISTVALIAAGIAVAVITAAAAYLYVSRRKPAAAAGDRIASLAVLPLANLSGDASQEYFADGMTEELITDLAKINALKVISRTSVMNYKGAKKPLRDIARELGVDSVVEGSVLRSGNRVRITAQLIDARTDTHVWAEHFDRDLRDVLALQTDVARAIAQQIRVVVTPAEQKQLTAARPLNPVAHELYLKGRYLWWKRRPAEMAQAITAFEQAIAADPGYAAAYAGLADAYAIGVDNGFFSPEIGRTKAKAAALKAVELDDSLAEAHVALALVYENYDWDWARSEAEFRRSLELNPNSAIVNLEWAAHLNTVGHHDEAIAANLKATALDPLAIRIFAHLAWGYYCARRYDEAIQAANKALALDPDDLMAHLVLGETYLQKGMPAEALQHMEITYRGGRTNAACCGTLARALVAAGKTGDATRVFASWIAQSRRSYKSAYVMAEAELALGTPNDVFQWLQKAYRQRDPQLPTGVVDPMWDPVRSDARFIDLARRMNLRP